MARVLYVDWDAQAGAWVRNVLGSAGIECLLETRGGRVCDVLKQSGASAVLMEVMLPEVSGFETCRRIRADRELFTLPVMLVSSMSAEEELHHGLRQGADDFLPKPCDPTTLLSRLKALLDGAVGLGEPDPLTALMNHRMAKYEIQHRISRKSRFALACMELVNLVEFGRAAGVDARNKALRHAARILEAAGERIKDPGFLVAHMGAGHFVAMLSPGSAERFCKAAHKSWQEHEPELYEALGITAAVAEHERTRSHDGGVPPVRALVYCTGVRSSAGHSVHACFENLAQLRLHARGLGEGVYTDRRVQ